MDGPEDVLPVWQRHNFHRCTNMYHLCNLDPPPLQPTRLQLPLSVSNSSVAFLFKDATGAAGGSNDKAAVNGSPQCSQPVPESAPPELRPLGDSHSQLVFAPKELTHFAQSRWTSGCLEFGGKLGNGCPSLQPVPNSRGCPEPGARSTLNRFDARNRLTPCQIWGRWPTRCGTDHFLTDIPQLRAKRSKVIRSEGRGPTTFSIGSLCEATCHKDPAKPQTRWKPKKMDVGKEKHDKPVVAPFFVRDLGLLIRQFCILTKTVSINAIDTFRRSLEQFYPERSHLDCHTCTLYTPSD